MSFQEIVAMQRSKFLNVYMKGIVEGMMADEKISKFINKRNKKGRIYIEYIVYK